MPQTLRVRLNQILNDRPKDSVSVEIHPAEIETIDELLCKISRQIAGMDVTDTTEPESRIATLLIRMGYLKKENYEDWVEYAVSY